MNQLQRILVVIDSDSDYSSANTPMPIEMQKALRLVRDKEATEVHLFCAAYQGHLDHDSLSWDFDQAQKREEHCDQLTANVANLAAALKSEGYQCSSDVVWAYPRYKAVMAKAKEIDASLVVQHTRSYGKLELHHLTNDSWQMVRHCSTPLLLVKNEQWHAIPKLIAAVDPMHSHHKPLELDNRILDAATMMEEILSGELHVVHGYAETARPFAPVGIIESEHRKAMDGFLSDYSVPAERLHFMDETPMAALQQKIRELKTNILVMGAISRSRLSEMLIGSTAERVLDFLDTDVLVIKPRKVTPE